MAEKKKEEQLAKERAAGGQKPAKP